MLKVLFLIACAVISARSYSIGIGFNEVFHFGEYEDTEVLNTEDIDVNTGVFHLYSEDDPSIEGLEEIETMDVSNVFFLTTKRGHRTNGGFLISHIP
jgi:hypothetical protein